VGDLAADTAVAGGNGRYAATLSDDWTVWGPHGGYVAAVALRAIGAEADVPEARPVACSFQFVRTARFAPVAVTVTTLRRTRRAQALRAEMYQDGERVLEAHAWVASPADGLAHDHAPMPAVAGPEDTPDAAARYDSLPADDPAPRPAPMFRRTVDCRILDFERWTSSEPGPAEAAAWLRFVPRATFDDPWVDASRALIVLDTLTWGAACRAHGGGGRWMAPTLDLTAQFHRAAPDEPWFLACFRSAFAGAGAIATTGRVWARDGRLVASGASSLLCTPRPG
jgi:acyl-CoA thioesterase II